MTRIYTTLVNNHHFHSTLLFDWSVRLQLLLRTQFRRLDLVDDFGLLWTRVSRPRRNVDSEPALDLYHVFTFFNECIKPASTWALLKPLVASLVSAFVFPLLSFTPERQQLWESDPGVDGRGEGTRMFETVRTALQPRLGRLVTSLLALSAESDLDVLNASLEHLVDADDDKTFAAMGVAKMLWTVVSSAEGAPQVLREIAGVVTPEVILTLEVVDLDLFDFDFDWRPERLRCH
ncbi:hypothetical protein BDZ89DRAFT_1147267 [Hymenopellis radicata]|nr:hypothetical protein BDZ89DRAFT_1147267 [Hymenopellis radicata]